jgi:hypothetical protein
MKPYRPCPPGSVEKGVGEPNRFEINKASYRISVNENVYRCKIAVSHN